ncbi:hypothetical protein F7P75_08240 [Acinetobacter gandensis]|nr:hypothetical protein F7P75_08240 [Acinetobacter gandensis]
MYFPENVKLLSSSRNHLFIILYASVHFLPETLIFWTFPQLSTKPVDNFVDSKRLDSLSRPYFKASI